MRSLRVQLLFSHLLLVALMLVVMGGAIVNFFHLGGSIDKILTDNYLSVQAAQNMKETLERQDSAATFFLANKVDKARMQYEDNVSKFRYWYQVEEHNITEPGEKELADDIGKQSKTYTAEIRKLLYAPQPMPQQQASAYYFSVLEPAFLRLKDRAQDVLDLNQTAIKKASERAKAEARRATLTAVGVTVGAFVVALLFALRMIRITLAPLRSLARQAEEIGLGHWNQRIEVRRDDEVGVLAASFNRMGAQLAEAWHEEEKRLHRAERMSDSALENLYDPVIVTDANARIVHLNRAAEGLFGPEDRAVGRSVDLAVPDRRIAEAVARAVHQERISAAEDEAGLVTLQAGDAQRTYRLRATPMRDDDNSLLGAVAVLEDITHLRELDRMKNEFIGVASHELRTPVTSLLLSVQLLQEGAVGELTPDQREVVDTQREDLERLQRMMRDLLDVTRLEAGVTPPRYEIIPARIPADNAVQSVQAQAHTKGVDLTTEIEADLPTVRADPGQISRALVNLLNNAIRHTPQGGTVRMRVRHDDAKVLYAVEDTGTGIPADYLPRIFDRFVQVPGATRGGAGLGLSIAQTIVKAHGSSIQVASEPGKGSCFSFTLEAEK